MALQELDLKMEYRPGKSNGRADPLSRYPVSLLASDCSSTQTAAVVANVDASDSPAKSGEEKTLAERQQDDPSKSCSDSGVSSEKRTTREGRSRTRVGPGGVEIHGHRWGVVSRGARQDIAHHPTNSRAPASVP